MFCLHYFNNVYSEKSCICFDCIWHDRSEDEEMCILRRRQSSRSCQVRWCFVWGYEFGTCSPLSSSGEPEPSGGRPAGHKSAIVLHINQTEEGQVAFPQPTPQAHPANLHEWTAFLAGSDWPSELREDVCLFNQCDELSGVFVQCRTPGINPLSLTLRGGRPTSTLTSLSFHCSRFPSFHQKKTD